MAIENTLYASRTCGHCRAAIKSASLYPEFVVILYPDQDKIAYDAMAKDQISQTPTMMTRERNAIAGASSIEAYLQSTYGVRTR